MILQPLKSVPVWLATLALLAVSLVLFLRPALVERLENVTYDLRVRQALRFGPSVSTNLGFIYMDEKTVQAIQGGSLGYRLGLYWPRQIYGFAIHQLAARQARWVALDVIFGELRPDHPSVALADGEYVHSDDFFARELARAGNTILAVTREIVPPELFLTNAAAAGDITTEKDADGILRRARAYRDYPSQWHPAFRQAEADRAFGVDLRQARIEPGRVVLPRPSGEDIVVPLDGEGNFDLADFGGENLPPGTERKAKPVTTRRAWHMGIVLAARQLGLDLDHAKVEPALGRVTLPGAGGLQRVIPIDPEGYFYIDWSMPLNHPALYKQSLHSVLAEYHRDLAARTNGSWPLLKDKLILIGSAAVLGNDLTDRGATPLESDTLLVSKHWNVANSVLMNRFVRRTPWQADFLLIILAVVLAALSAARLRVTSASVAVLFLVGACVVGAFAAYIHGRLWIPLVLPLLGIFLAYASILTWRVLFEETEQRRVRSIFSTVVSPKIVNELLRAEALPLGGARREVTILFADVRGFTEFTEASQERVSDYVQAQQLTGTAAEACYDQQARETLKTVNTYLGLVADTIIRGDGTLDKFIGDCVMAFWGAPSSHPGHALACARAAIEVQRAIHRLNLQRHARNESLAAENLQRAAKGLPPLPLLPILELGTGINTGMVTVGLMGSEAKTRNYTVFGRDVNLASRLESISGHSRILITQATYNHLLQADPALAATCKRLDPVQVKGIRTPITVFELPWKEDAPPQTPAKAEAPPSTAEVGSP